MIAFVIGFVVAPEQNKASTFIFPDSPSVVVVCLFTVMILSYSAGRGSFGQIYSILSRDGKVAASTLPSLLSVLPEFTLRSEFGA